MARTWPGNTSNERVETANHTAINNPTDLTVTAWLRRTGAGGNNLGRVCSKGAAAATEWQIYCNVNAADAFQFDANRWPTAGQWRGTGVTANTWEWWGVTYSFSSTSNDPVIYKNGSTVNVTEQTTPSGTITTPSGADFAIGNVAGSSAARAWAGQIQHLCFWNRVLSAIEIKTIYYGGPSWCTSGLLAWYPLEGLASPEPNLIIQGDACRPGVVTGTTTGAANVPWRVPVWASR
jgi:hypothetical protein